MSQTFLVINDYEIGQEDTVTSLNLFDFVWKLQWRIRNYQFEVITNNAGTPKCIDVE